MSDRLTRSFQYITKENCDFVLYNSLKENVNDRLSKNIHIMSNILLPSQISSRHSKTLCRSFWLNRYCFSCMWMICLWSSYCIYFLNFKYIQEYLYFFVLWFSLFFYQSYNLNGRYIKEQFRSLYYFHFLFLWEGGGTDNACQFRKVLIKCTLCFVNVKEVKGVRNYSLLI